MLRRQNKFPGKFPNFYMHMHTCFLTHNLDTEFVNILGLNAQFGRKDFQKNLKHLNKFQNWLLKFLTSFRKLTLGNSTLPLALPCVDFKYFSSNAVYSSCAEFIASRSSKSVQFSFPPESENNAIGMRSMMLSSSGAMLRILLYNV